MPGKFSVYTEELRSASQRLSSHAPDATQIPSDLKTEARQADQANRGFMTGEAGESLADEVAKAMEHYKEHIEFEVDAIKDCAEDWDDADKATESAIDAIAAELSSFRVPRIAGGA
ncbi:hypothetical protein O1R50_25785 [Glycomyces luteolus]|uniref:Uncharacterized protein n=1 Tax=Glycomyces luteolus TaxID=2670330 RepID=A0A9X3PQ12_9ACTN|nr:hypothetical protein [Glycomyces luteolus]MDA1363050.1 hypothetical protein [Glycomyces luteolus]